jgi:hypothetical protein
VLGGTEQELAALALIVDEIGLRRIHGLVECELALIRLAESRSKRLRGIKTTPRSGVERHLEEAGHELAFGCCAAAS